MLIKMSKAMLSMALLAGFVGVVQAADQPPSREEAAIKFRKSAYTTLMWYFGPIVRTAKGDIPYDKGLIARNAEYVAFLSKLPRDGFIPGSDKGETKAKPEIWTNSAKFKDAADALERETAKLAEIAKGGNLEAIKEQAGKVQKACKSCHDDFKKKEEDKK